MSNIIKPVTITHYRDLDLEITVDAAVDASMMYVTLPLSMKCRLGSLEKASDHSITLRDGTTHSTEVYGPLKIQIEGFNAFYSSVEFVDAPEGYAPRIGYTALSQSLTVSGSQGDCLEKLDSIYLPGVKS
jgi:hypothetical protein